MSDPRRPDGYDPNRPYWSQPTEQFPPADPAYGGYYSYPSYVPPASDTTRELPAYWTQTQYQPPQPAPPEPPAEPPNSPRWLWLLAGAAVTLVIGLVVALVIANGSNRDDTAVAPLPPMPEPTTTLPIPTLTTRTAAPRPTRTPTTTPEIPPPITTPPDTDTTTDPTATETVVYSVTGLGRAISITYVDTGGVLQMEFNAALPWSKQVTLSRSTARAASVTVINVGREIACSITLNGVQAERQSGTGLTICSLVGG